MNANENKPKIYVISCINDVIYKTVADFYDIDKDGNLNLSIFDKETEFENVATFKKDYWLSIYRKKKD